MISNLPTGRTSSPASAPRRPRAVRKTDRRASPELRSAEHRLREGSAPDLAALNAHPINQHALTLLPKWSLQPDPRQLHLLTLAAPIKFANATQAAFLAEMRTSSAPAAVLDRLSEIASFEESFLAESKPLEAVHVLLAAAVLAAVPLAD